MKYLFFDVECAICYKHGKARICEFGYVLTDEKFNIIKTDEFVINPDSVFDNYALKNILTYKKEEYYASPKFDNYAEEIKSLLSCEETYVIGHTTECDVGYVASEFDRYGYEPFKYAYYDVQKAFLALEDVDFSSLEKMIEYYDLSVDGKMHNAQTDAMATMLVLKRLSEKFSKSVDELIALKPKKKKAVKKKLVEYYESNEGVSISELIGGEIVENEEK